MLKVIQLKNKVENNDTNNMTQKYVRKNNLLFINKLWIVYFEKARERGKYVIFVCRHHNIVKIHDKHV